MALKKGPYKIFSVLVEFSSDSLVFMSEDGGVVLASRALLHVLELSPKEVLGKSLAPSVHPEDWHSLLRSLAGPEKREGDVPRVPIRLKAGDGTWRPMVAIFLHLPSENRAHFVFFGRGEDAHPEAPGLVPNPFAAAGRVPSSSGWWPSSARGRPSCRAP